MSATHDKLLNDTGTLCSRRLQSCHQRITQKNQAPPCVINKAHTHYNSGTYQNRDDSPASWIPFRYEHCHIMKCILIITAVMWATKNQALYIVLLFHSPLFNLYNCCEAFPTPPCLVETANYLRSNPVKVKPSASISSERLCSFSPIVSFRYNNIYAPVQM